MHITHTWNVESLEKATVAGINDVVLQTYWTLTAQSSDGISVCFEGATPLEFDPQKKEFVKFEDLTEEIVINWIQSHLIQEDALDDLKQELAEQIDCIRSQTQREQVQTESLPWNR